MHIHVVYLSKKAQYYDFSMPKQLNNTKYALLLLFKPYKFYLNLINYCFSEKLINFEFRKILLECCLVCKFHFELLLVTRAIIMPIA